MMNPGCAEVREWLQQALRSHRSPSLAPHISLHLSTCPRCRGALAALALESLGLAAVPQPLSCQRCEAELAAFIDLEIDEGSVEAIRTYPRVWWHFWTCETCAETYRLTRAALQHTASMNTSATRRQTIPHWHGMRLPRAFLHRALATSNPRRGPGDGVPGPRNVLVRNDDADQHLTVSVSRQPGGDWRIDVCVVPAPDGRVILKFGAQHFFGHFDAQGNATVYDVPDVLLTAAVGPDMEVDFDGRC